MPAAPAATGPRSPARRRDRVEAHGRTTRSSRCKVSLGITDHAFTEVAGLIKGGLKPDDDVVTASIVSKSPAPGGVRR